MDGIPGQLRIAYKLVPGTISIRKIESDVRYQAFWVNPEDGSRTPIGVVEVDNKGNWKTPRPPIFRDWLVILERA